MRNGALFLILVSLAGALLTGATCEKLATPNLPPQTFFREGGVPPAVLNTDNWDFKWFGRDPDSDFENYYYRLFVGSACDDTLPAIPDETWVRTRQQTASFSFADVERFPDTTYVFQVLTEDEHGAFDVLPAKACFRIAIQLPPMIDTSCVVVPPPRTQTTSAEFQFCAIKYTRAGTVKPGVRFSYDVQLTEIAPSQQVHTAFSGAFTPQTTKRFDALKPNSRYAFQVKAVDDSFPNIISETYRVEWQN